ncbi:MAG TPA: DUF1579 family protein [Thermoanaerobaculia bacterium]
MDAFASLIGLTGRWRGKYRLTVAPGDPTRESNTTAIVAPVAGGRFARIDYTWGERDKPDDGSILFGRDRERGVVTALWVDSWHMSGKVLTCEGPSAGAGSLEVLGSYPAPPGPDWGWRTVVETAEEDVLRMLMYNVPPDGDEYVAVEATYRRAD